MYTGCVCICDVHSTTASETASTTSTISQQCTVMRTRASHSCAGPCMPCPHSCAGPSLPSAQGHSCVVCESLYLAGPATHPMPCPLYLAGPRARAGPPGCGQQPCTGPGGARGLEGVRGVGLGAMPGLCWARIALGQPIQGSHTWQPYRTARCSADLLCAQQHSTPMPCPLYQQHSTPGPAMPCHALTAALHPWLECHVRV